MSISRRAGCADFPSAADWRGTDGDVAVRTARPPIADYGQARFLRSTTRHLAMRRPRRLAIALALLAGATGVALLPRKPVDTAAPPTSIRAPKSPKNLGPLPLALPEEPPARACLTGIQPADNEDEASVGRVTVGGDSPHTGQFAGLATPSNDSWRPSARPASSQPAGFEGRAARQVDAAAPTKPKRQQTVILHRVADGDTLSSLAHRYGGAGVRSADLFEANRDQLQSPELLPIGAVLRIPIDPAGQK
jgi:nucleoid-associated protein YgaU